MEFIGQWQQNAILNLPANKMPSYQLISQISQAFVLSYEVSHISYMLHLNTLHFKQKSKHELNEA